MYITETVPAKWRGRLVAVYQLAVVSGILLAYLSNYAMANTDGYNWHHIFVSQVVPSVIFGLLLVLVPASPRWLIKAGQEHEAKETLTRTGGKYYCNHEFAIISHSFQTEQEATVSELFEKKHLLVLIIGISVAVFQQVTGINAILYDAPLIFEKTGVGTEDSLLQTIDIGVANVLSTFITISLVDKVGRKKFLLMGCVLMGLLLTAIALCMLQL
jgi:SP family arabinose:H+ symporter-like MFS transporter